MTDAALPHRFQIPVGDWSDDGHGKCEWFKVSSTHSVEDVREMLFEVNDQRLPGFAEYFADYEASSIREDEYEGLIALAPAAVDLFEETEENDVLPDYYLRNGAESYVRLLIAVIEACNEGVRIQIEDEEKLPMLPFYGHDDQGRHLRYGGYGLFF